MRSNYGILPVLVGLMLGCAITPMPPDAEARNALTPTGKLRVGIQLNNPVQVTKDAATGELKGVAIDLGKDLARRIGVPFSPVGYPSVSALIESAGSNE